jgi:hypothetical protein
MRDTRFDLVSAGSAAAEAAIAVDLAWEGAAQAELRRGLAKVKAGDVIGVVAGTRLASGSTNFMRLHVVRDNLSGTRARRKKRNRR